MSPKRTHQELSEFDEKAKATGFRFLFGIDEAGRGPLAGPVVAAAVCLRDTNFVSRIGDSKLLSPRQREQASAEILERAWVGIGLMDEKVIDEVNILRATYLAMTAAVQELLGRIPAEQQATQGFASSVKVLIDGNSYRGKIPFKIETVIQGDAKSLSIACASIVAKVHRDRLMLEYDRIYPDYGFALHKGYPTTAHRAAIKKFGHSPIHRRSFRVVL